MADSDRTWNGLVPMEDADVEIEKNEPDPRGWDVISADGRKIGEVDGMFVDTAAMKVRYLEVPVDSRKLHLDDDADRRLMIPIRAVELDVDDERVLVPTLQSSRIAGLRGRVDLAGESTGTSVSPPERAAMRDPTDPAGRELEAGRADLRAERPDTNLHTELAARVRALEGRAASADRAARVGEESSARKRPLVREELVLVKRTIRDGNIEETGVHREPLEADRPGSRDRENSDKDSER